MSEPVTRECARCGNPTDRPLCQPCQRAVERALRELPALYCQLSMQLEPGSGTGEHVSGSREAPIPLRAGHSALMTDMTGTCEDVEDALRDVLGYTERPRRGREGHRLEGSSRWLLAQLDRLIHAHPDPLTACDELRRLRTRALSLLGLINPPDRLPTPCSDCDMIALIRQPGSGQVICGYCGQWWDEDGYERLVGMRLAVALTEQQEAS